MTSSKKPTDQERREYESAVDNFMDLLARVIAREHLRRSSEDAPVEKTGKEKPGT